MTRPGAPTHEMRAHPWDEGEQRVEIGGARVEVGVDMLLVQAGNRSSFGVEPSQEVEGAAICCRFDPFIASRSVHGPRDGRRVG